MTAIAPPAPAPTCQAPARSRPAPPQSGHARKPLRSQDRSAWCHVATTVAPAAGGAARRATRPPAPATRKHKPLPAGQGPTPVLTPAARPRRQWDRLQIHAQTPQRGGEALAELAQGPRPAPPGQSPDKAAALLVGACVEVLSGHRAAHLLTRRTTPELYDAIARRASLAQRLLGREALASVPRVRSCHAQQTHPGKAEAVVLLEAAGKVRAAAAHLVLRRGRWLLAGLEIA